LSSKGCESGTRTKVTTIGHADSAATVQCYTLGHGIFDMKLDFEIYDTYDHRRRSILDAVCSPYVKPLTGGLVVRWVTTSESPLL
jgi:hypothetical protein